MHVDIEGLNSHELWTIPVINEVVRQESLPLDELYPLLEGLHSDQRQPLKLEYRGKVLAEGKVGKTPFWAYKSPRGVMVNACQAGEWKLLTEYQFWRFQELFEADVCPDMTLAACLKLFSLELQYFRGWCEGDYRMRSLAINELDAWAEEVKRVGYGVQDDSQAGAVLEQLTPVAIYSGLANSSKSTD